PKSINFKGKDVSNVFHLRTPEDANSIARLASSKNAVIVGTSFIGMEVAAALTDKAHSVSVIGIDAVPFRKALGEKVGKALMKVRIPALHLLLSFTEGKFLFVGKQRRFFYVISLGISWYLYYTWSVRSH
ncbi:apoptosis-inducing factor 3, partial [Tachysurus ichikawai]